MHCLSETWVTCLCTKTQDNLIHQSSKRKYNNKTTPNAFVALAIYTYICLYMYYVFTHTRIHIYIYSSAYPIGGTVRSTLCSLSLSLSLTLSSGGSERELMLYFAHTKLLFFVLFQANVFYFRYNTFEVFVLVYLS